MSGKRRKRESTRHTSFPYQNEALVWNEDHTRNEAGVYCYCGKDYKDTEIMLRCKHCRQLFHPDCVQCLPNPPLHGDSFYEFTCSVCTKGTEHYHRLPMSWMVAVHLVIYHLMKSFPEKEYFRWKEDICALIDEYWDFLVPGKAKSQTWHNTVASALSTHSSIFMSGYEKQKQAGWWKLRECRPPEKGVKNKSGRSTKISTPSRSHSTPNKRANPVPSTSGNNDRDTISVEEQKSPPSSSINQPIGTPNQSQHTRREISSFFEGCAEGASTPILFDNFDPSQLLSGSDSPEFRSKLISANKQDTAAKRIKFEMHEKEEEKDAAEIVEANIPLGPAEPKIVENLAVNSTPSLNQEKSEKSQNVVENAAESKSENSDMSNNKEKKLQATPKEKRLAIGQQEEWEMLQRLENARKPLCARASRLRRKLQLRRMKRSLGLKIFDLDALVTTHLRSPHELEPIIFSAKQPLSTEILAKQLEEHTKTITNTPYANSFLSRLYGSPHLSSSLTSDEAWTSPYLGRKLRPFIRRDYEIRPPKMALLQDIISYSHRHDPEWIPPPLPPIDYCYIQREHLTQVNSLLCRCLWPGIDISEALLFQDFSIVALYKRLVIGCAFMTPEGYVTYIAVAPGWDRVGIGQFMLYHLLQTAMGRDLTLHVSANNRAMLLYQKFGFKPEEFIVNFYDKYLPEGSIECKNAFFLRLRR
ncbi:uncharacterized protein VTP21DRAFT_2030 [Calcarisporiella thermophila]|uniref:uncharacterized protein n=1 Tax=Calcarisporiella thermophila TaxID=911321 RepID=UPI0037443F88